jgi:tetratricopeptide (TPR) repeat protein
MKSYEDQYYDIFKNENGSLLTVIKKVKKLTERAKQWPLYDATCSVENNYKYMLRYIDKSGIKLGGTEDVEQHKMLDKFKEELFQIYQSLIRENEYANDTNIYYSKLRFTRLRPGDTITSLAADYRAELNRLSQDLIAVTNPKYRAKAEQIITDLFNLIFVTYPLTPEDIDAIKSLYSDDNIPEHVKELLVSAIFLGLTYFMDYPRLDLLLTIYEIGSTPVAAAAISAFNLIVTHKEDIESNLISEHLAKLQQSETWGSDMTTVLTEQIRATHALTDNANQFASFKSGLNNFSERMLKRMQEMGVDASDPEALERFMSDEGMLNDSTYQQLKNTQDKLAQGEDVFLEPFSKLKTGTFYSEPVNWFMPFHTDHSAIADIVMSTANTDTTTSIADIIDSMTTMCDCDKYSLILSLTNIPPSMRNTALSQLSVRQEDLAAINKDQPDDEVRFRWEVNRYMKNLTRFFKLSPFKDDVENMLSESDLNSEIVDLYTGVDWLPILELAHKYVQAEIMQIALFKLNNELTNGITSSDFNTCLTFGKIAIDNAQHKMAITYLTKALAIKPDDIDAIHTLAWAYQLNNQDDEAIKLYKQSHITETNDLKSLHHYADMLMEAKDYSNALDVYFQIEYLDADDTRAQHDIARIYFNLGDLKSAELYLNRLKNNENESYFSTDDDLMRGYINLVNGKFDLAIANYIDHCKTFNFNYDEVVTDFIDDIENTYPSNVDSGISHETAIIIADIVRFNLDKDITD